MLDKTKLSRDYEKEPLGSWEDIPEQDLRYLYCDSGMNKTDICKYLPCCTAKLYRLVKKYKIHKKVQGVDPALLAKVDWSRLRRNYIEEPLKWREMPTKEEVAYLYIELEFSRVDISRFFGRGDSEKFAQALITKYQIRLPKEITTRHIADAYKAKTGYSSPLANPEVHKKAQETCLKRYGATSWMKTDAAKQAQGVTLNTPEMIERAKVTRENTNLKRYGVKHTGSLPSVIAQRRETNLARYHAVNYIQSQVSPESLEILNTKEALIQLFMEYPEYNTIAIGKLLGVVQTTVLRRLKQYDLMCLVQQPTSSFERELKQLFPTVELRKDRTVLEGKEIDLYAPEFKIGLEFNGNYWHSDAQKVPLYHKLKSEKAAKKGVFLFHIFEYEWMIPERKQAIINHLKQVFNLNKNIVFADACTIKPVDADTGTNFLEQYHIHGSAYADVWLGVYNGQELVALMTFSKNNIAKGYQWKLVRYCCKADTTVVGGAVKAFNYFVTEHNPTSIISYADIAKTTDVLYTTLGFTYHKTTAPKFKWTDGNTTLTATQCDKKQLIACGWKQPDDGKHESQIMREHNFFKIYDCGRKVWVWVNKHAEVY